MDTDKDALEAVQWKTRYLDQLEESERKEKQWHAADDLLRRTVSRLTLAADGIDDLLDRQLRDLRNAIRDRASTANLGSLVEDMSRTLVRLDKGRKKHEPQQDQRRPLLELLEALKLPENSKRRIKKLKKQLSSGDGGDSKAAIEAFAALIGDACAASAGKDAPEVSPGLLARLFHSKQRPQPGHSAHAPLTAPDIPAPLPMPVAQPQAHTEAISAAVTDIPHQETLDTVREILIQLLERLSLPDELIDRVEAIRDLIDHVGDGDSWDSVLEQIADLIQAIRAQTQQERQGITNFLQQLTERLQEVDRQLQGSEQHFDDALAAGERLDTAVKDEMSGMEVQVRDARDLDTLKQVVQLRIDTVLEHMQIHQNTEQQRYSLAKQQIAHMGGRLRDLERETGSLRERIREEHNQAMTDALTGIPNRLAYEDRLQREIARWKRFGTPLVLVMWDVDLFKRINDDFGHKAGDKVLRTIAQVLARGVRETDFVARYGGEEFVQLMTGSSLVDCLPVADKLRAAVEATGFHFRQNAVTITASCGLADFRAGDTAEQCFERADQALYRAKQQGRNRCEAAE
ncbi:MAG: diguanylate cyclase [Thiogranum sp.]|nr:diguanylate cyclase [Thiogranum sp.]